METIVRNGKYFTVGENGAEFANIRKGDIIFNHKQTEELFNNGHVTSGGGRAKVVGEALASGTAYSSAHGRFNYGSSGSNAYSSSSNSSTSSSYNTSSSNNNTNTSNTNSDTSSKEKATENLIDWIKVFYDRISRLADLAEKAIDRAIGLVNKQAAATDAINRVQDELSAAQQAANKYLEYANQVDLSDEYKRKIQNGELSIENITDENLKDAVSKYQERYETMLL